MSPRTAHHQASGGRIIAENEEHEHQHDPASRFSNSVAKPSPHCAADDHIKSEATAFPTKSSSNTSIDLPSTTKQPSSPVLVNSAAANTMHVSMQSNSPVKAHDQLTKTSEKAPPPTAFSINSILSSFQSDDSAQDDINAIAEIYGRSKLSLANSYNSHRSPVCSGGNTTDDADDSAGLILDTNAATRHPSVSNLETVEELPSSGSFTLADTRRLGSTNSRTTTENVPQVAKPEHNSGTPTPAVWQVKAKVEPIISSSSTGESERIEALGRTGTSQSGEESALRDHVSSGHNSRAVRELLRFHNENDG